MLTATGREQRNNLLRELGIDPDQARSVTLEFDVHGSAILVVESVVPVGDDGLGLLELAVRSPEVSGD